MTFTIGAGDEPHVDKIRHHLAAVTHHGSLAYLLHMVTEHARAHQVSDSVIADIFAEGTAVAVTMPVPVVLPTKVVPVLNEPERLHATTED